MHRWTLQRACAPEQVEVIAAETVEVRLIIDIMISSSRPVRNGIVAVHRHRSLTRRPNRSCQQRQAAHPGFKAMRGRTDGRS